MLKVVDLRVETEKKTLLRDVNIIVKRGEISAVMGKNGSGKSSLANSLMGHPDYVVTKGEIEIDGKKVTNSSTDERARSGLFLAFQHPVEIDGVSVRQVLLAAMRGRADGLDIGELKRKIELAAEELGIEAEMLKRGVNTRFSGGEKKKMELLQIKVLEPKYAILDETDSGLDVDAVKMLGKQIKVLVEEKKIGLLLITHNNQLLRSCAPAKVIVLEDGKVVAMGGREVVDKLEESGYQQFQEIL